MKKRNSINILETSNIIMKRRWSLLQWTCNITTKYHSPPSIFKMFFCIPWLMLQPQTQQCSLKLKTWSTLMILNTYPSQPKLLTSFNTSSNIIWNSRKAKLVHFKIGIYVCTQKPYVLQRTWVWTIGHTQWIGFVIPIHIHVYIPRIYHICQYNIGFKIMYSCCLTIIQH